MGSGASVVSINKTVVVVGGGYAGIAVAEALTSCFDVIVFEARGAFNHSIVGLRACVDESFAAKCVIPLDHALKRGKIIIDEVVG